jgi:hypothetical protein
MISVALEGFLFNVDVSREFSEAEAKLSARSREPATTDNITRDLPRPISSAMIPPLASAGSGCFVPLKICW